MRTIATFVLIFVGTCVHAAHRTDSCQTQIPKDLTIAVTTAFPGCRMPRETDNLPDDVEYNKTHGGNGCLGIAVADFKGDHHKDYLLGLTAKKGASGLAVIALSSETGWQFQKIRSWTEDARIRQYVEAVKPSKHERTEALEGPLSSGEKDSMQCQHWGALVGATESTGIVYCYIDGRWSYVRVSD